MALSETYLLKLVDNTILEVFDDSAGNWLTHDEIDENILSEDNTSHVIVTEPDGKVFEYFNLISNGIFIWRDYKGFRLRERTDLEKIQLESDAKIDYLAAMTGVDLDE